MFFLKKKTGSGLQVHPHGSPSPSSGKKQTDPASVNADMLAITRQHKQQYSQMLNLQRRGDLLACSPQRWAGPMGIVGR